MASIRESILEGTKAAAKIHNDFGIRKAIEGGSDRVDVFGMLLRLNVSLLFRPLKGLLGACLRNPALGVLISTQRPLRIQRFTGAHELGHIVLGHAASLDGEEILALAPNKRMTYEPNEAAANAFAVEFLMPLWLFREHARRQGWNRESLKDPATVYQLSLRIGASYEATARTLNSHKLIDGRVLDDLLGVQPKKIKQGLLGGAELEDWHADVWSLNMSDNGIRVEGSPGDVLVLSLTEHSAGGYLWQTDSLERSGFSIIFDDRAMGEEDVIGGNVTRVLQAQSVEAQSGHLQLEERRPWQTAGDAATEFSIDYDLYGKEDGLPRIVRRQLRAS